MPVKFKNTTGDLNTKNPRYAWKYPSSDLILDRDPDVIVRPGQSVDVTGLMKNPLVADKIAYFIKIGIGDLEETRGVSARGTKKPKEEKPTPSKERSAPPTEPKKGRRGRSKKQ